MNNNSITNKTSIKEEDLETQKLSILKDLFTIIHIHINTIEDLLNIEIDRMVLLEDPFYSYAMNYKEIIKKKYNKIYSSNYYNFTHNNAITKQKFPSINLLRQILKSNHLKLSPYYKSFGYDNNKKKIVQRYFIITSIEE
jgi:hypothetical protein|tara:strand:- start:74 stop:493 length:420 start_codon:yes stop_codon:yes gene_type:complete